MEGFPSKRYWYVVHPASSYLLSLALFWNFSSDEGKQIAEQTTLEYLQCDIFILSARSK